MEPLIQFPYTFVHSEYNSKFAELTKNVFLKYDSHKSCVAKSIKCLQFNTKVQVLLIENK